MGLAHLFGRKKRNEELMIKIINGDAEAVRALLNNRADPNFIWNTKQAWSTAKHITPLLTALYAPKDTSVAIVQALLDKGANPNVIIKSSNHHIDYINQNPYQSMLLFAVIKVATASDQHMRQINSDIYCALRFAGADMYCTPSKHEHKGDMSFANLDYMEWDLSIDSYLDKQDARAVWEELEQTFESVRQKRALKEALGETTNTPSRRLKI